MTGELGGRVAIVTGGGRGIPRVFATAGAAVSVALIEAVPPAEFSMALRKTRNPRS